MDKLNFQQVRWSHRITESLRLEKTSQIIKSNHQPNISMTAKPCPAHPIPSFPIPSCPIPVGPAAMGARWREQALEFVWGCRLKSRGETAEQWEWKINIFSWPVWALQTK